MKIAVDSAKQAPVGKVEETAEAVARAIRAAPEWREFQRAQEAFQSDEDLQQKLARHRELSEARQHARDNGQNWAGPQVAELIALQDQLQRHPVYMRRQEAGEALAGLRHTVNQVISENLGVDFAGNAAPPHRGCCGSFRNSTTIKPRNPKMKRAAVVMTKLAVYDPAMCCSTGVCGPNVDLKLAQFAANVKWLQEQGVEVARFSLSQNPAAFVENEMVKTALTEKGEAALPLLLVEGEVMTSGTYPTRAQLAKALGLTAHASLFTPAIAELVAIGAAIAANCEPCLKYHYRQAQLLGVSKADMASAVEMAAKVKDSPHQAILRLADRLTASDLSTADAAADPCCGSADSRSGEPAGKCCG